MTHPALGAATHLLASRSFVNHVGNFWLDLLLKAAMVLVFFLVAPLGVGFDGHPNLARLLLPEEFEGHPLRKEFALLTREAKPWPGAKEPGE